VPGSREALLQRAESCAWAGHLAFSQSKHLILLSQWGRMRRAQDVDVD
jgi:hypothetical protein